MRTRRHTTTSCRARRHSRTGMGSLLHDGRQSFTSTPSLWILALPISGAIYCPISSRKVIQAQIRPNGEATRHHHGACDRTALFRVLSSRNIDRTVVLIGRDNRHYWTAQSGLAHHMCGWGAIDPSWFGSDMKPAISRRGVNATMTQVRSTHTYTPAPQILLLVRFFCGGFFLKALAYV